MLLDLIGWIIFGLIVGGLARLLVPGRDPMGCFGTLALGVAGSLVGGFLGSLIFDVSEEGFQPAGFIGALIGGILVLLGVRQFRGKKD